MLPRRRKQDPVPSSRLPFNAATAYDSACETESCARECDAAPAISTPDRLEPHNLSQTTRSTWHHRLPSPQPGPNPPSGVEVPTWDISNRNIDLTHHRDYRIWNLLDHATDRIESIFARPVRVGGPNVTFDVKNRGPDNWPMDWLCEKDLRYLYSLFPVGRPGTWSGRGNKDGDGDERMVDSFVSEGVGREGLGEVIKKRKFQEEDEEEGEERLGHERIGEDSGGDDQDILRMLEGEGEGEGAGDEEDDDDDDDDQEDECYYDYDWEPFEGENHRSGVWWSVDEESNKV